MSKFHHGRVVPGALRFAWITLLAALAAVDQASAQFDSRSVGVHRYMLVNEEKALEVIQGQNQQLTEYADTVHHLNGVVGLLIDSLGGTEAEQD